jgi:NAD(P)-dependent dehydrogenase (short-subunit alcohol dehydrogenase family)
MQINAISPILLTQKIVKKKKIKKGGSVVFVSSIAGHTRSSVGNSMYCASKGTISGFVKCVSKELVIKKIRCNEVLPGQIDTPIMSQGAVTDEQMAALASHIPMKRLGDPDEIAAGIAFLLSDAASYITGSSLIIDGGLSL